jgi:solute:Na+ symporter, SSS family
MHYIDWIILAGTFVALAVVGVMTNRVSHSVSDFLAANRCGRRYLLTMAEGMGTLGAVSIVAYFESFYESGFSPIWWGLMLMPVNIIISLSGWVIYRYRETRAMTMAELFEMRYSKRFRVFGGIVAWVAGIINFGIFPAVGGRLIIYLTGLPVYTYTLGPVELNLTLGVVMAILLSVALFLTFSGGQITVMVADFFQGQFTNIALVAILIFVFISIGWGDLIEGLKQAPEDKNMINPFAGEHLFGFWFFAILVFSAFYSFMGWQGTQGYNCSAISPHEARMAKILGAFRGVILMVMLPLLPLVVYAVMHNPRYATQAATIQASLAQIPDGQIQIQQTVSVGLSHILPPGLLGLFVAIAVAASISTLDTYLHSWGSIFVQDVVLPFRKTRIGPEQHIRYLRRSIFGVAVFVWLFSMLFPLREYIFMFMGITGAIYLGGAGAAIIGGLYWKRGSTAGAWAGMITGSVLATGSVIMTNILWPYLLPSLQTAYPAWNWLQGLDPSRFPIHGAWLGFIWSVAALVVYVGVSLLSGAPAFNMDKMLHRGRYAITGEHTEADPKPSRGFKALGMGPEFTRSDRIIYLATLGWSLLFLAVFAAGTLYSKLVKPFSDDTWVSIWLAWTLFVGVMGVVTTIWFLWGGLGDLRKLFRDLKISRRDDLDDGTVLDQDHLSNSN